MSSLSFYGFDEFYEIHYVAMYKVYRGNYIIHYCMCTVNKCIYMELTIHGEECKAYDFLESI